MNYSFHRYYRGPLKGVVLDWAGTAVDYGSFAPTDVFLRLFESQNVKITAEDARSGMGLMKKVHLRTILERPAVAESWRAAHGALPADSDIDTLFDQFIPMQLSVLEEYAEPIPGLLDVMKFLHTRGMKVGSTTGYIRSMMDVLIPAAEKQGYRPDCVVCPDDVPAGRPYPWMCYQNAMQMGIYPMQAMVKVGDTFADVEEGLNAGMWTVGLSLTGNLLGLTESETEQLSPEDRDTARKKISTQLLQAGAHFVIDGIWDLPGVLTEIKSCLAHGEHP